VRPCQAPGSQISGEGEAADMEAGPVHAQPKVCKVECDFIVETSRRARLVWLDVGRRGLIGGAAKNVTRVPPGGLAGTSAVNLLEHGAL
jgi:hypothetical protein